MFPNNFLRELNYFKYLILSLVKLASNDNNITISTKNLIIWSEHDFIIHIVYANKLYIGSLSIFVFNFNLCKNIECLITLKLF